MARTIAYGGHWNKSVRGVVEGKYILNKFEELRMMDKDKGPRSAMIVYFENLFLIPCVSTATFIL